MIPRDQNSGLVCAWERQYGRPPTTLDATEQIPIEADECANPLFSTEIAVRPDGVLAIIFCAWQHGEIVLELDPFRTLIGLLAGRSIH